MGRRGPAKKPEALKKRDGTFREDRAGGVAGVPGVPQTPSWLSDNEKTLFNEVVALLNKTPSLLSQQDGNAIARYCVDWTTYQLAREQVAAEGITTTSEKGSVYQHPAVGIQNKAHERLARFEARFGMTPSDRASLSLPSEPGEDNPFEEFMRMRSRG